MSNVTFKFLLVLTLLVSVAMPPGAASGQGSGSGTAATQVFLDDAAARYEALFGMTFDVDSSRFLITTPVTGLGLYLGMNDAGIPYLLDVHEYRPFDMSMLDPVSEAQAQALGLESAEVVATISTGMASYEMLSSVVSWNDPVLGLQNALHPIEDVEALDLSTIVNPDSDFDLELVPECIVFSFVTPWFDASNSPECQACLDAYLDTMDSAIEMYKVRMKGARQRYAGHLAGAEAKYQIDIASARTVFRICMAAVEAAFVIAVIGCASGGPTALACTWGALAVKWSGVAACGAYYASSVSTAAGKRAVRVAVANGAYQADAEVAGDLFQLAAEEAAEDLEDCLEEHDCAATCTARVTYEVCLPADTSEEPTHERTIVIDC